MARGAPYFRFRFSLAIFVVGLVLSGVTAFPLLWELELLVRVLPVLASLGIEFSQLDEWIVQVHAGLNDSYARYPWIAYGTDWLAFGHLVIALFFIGPWRDPVGNQWVLKVGLGACVGVIPLALICGEIRSIPFFWRLIDCSFGLLGALPLLYCLRLVPEIANTQRADPATYRPQ